MPPSRAGRDADTPDGQGVESADYEDPTQPTQVRLLLTPIRPGRANPLLSGQTWESVERPALRGMNRRTSIAGNGRQIVKPIRRPDA